MSQIIIKVVSTILLAILLTSCVDKTQLETVTKNNERLTLKVDSLEKLLGQYEVLTVLNNNNFKAIVGETYSVESMAVLKAGLKMDSLFVNGRLISEDDSIVKINEGLFGPKISFRVNAPGNYYITAFVSSFAWDNKRSIKTKWTVLAQ